MPRALSELEGEVPQTESSSSLYDYQTQDGSSASSEAHVYHHGVEYRLGSVLSPAPDDSGWTEDLANLLGGEAGVELSLRGDIAQAGLQDGDQTRSEGRHTFPLNETSPSDDATENLWFGNMRESEDQDVLDIAGMLADVDLDPIATLSAALDDDRTRYEREISNTSVALIYGGSE